MTPPDSGGHSGEDHILGLVRGLARLEGTVEANFETLFRGQRTHAAEQHKAARDLAVIRERLAKLEARPSLRLVERKRLTAAKWSAIAVAIVTILGGISSAYHEGAVILLAIHRALAGK